MKILSLFTFILCYFLIAFPSFGQRTCHTPHSDYHKKNHQAGGEAFENRLQKLIAQKRQALRLQKTQRTESIYKIPIIVHVIHNGEPIGEGTNISAEQIYGQIEVMNEDLNFRNPNRDETLDEFKDVAADIGIELILATIDPEGNPLAEAGIHRIKGCRTNWVNNNVFDAEGKPNTIWNPNNYFNIWVANFRKGFYGYGQFPTLSGLEGMEGERDDSDTDGIVVNTKYFGSIEKTPNILQLQDAAPFNLGRTATHEVGHFFGVLHPWEGNSCFSDDFCEDTPNTRASHGGCNLNETEDACEEGQVVMVQNFMDYSDDACMTLFTEDQALRMYAVLENSPRRKELLSSAVAEPLGNQIFAIFKTNKTQVIEGGKIQFRNQSVVSGTAQIERYEWTFEGGIPSTSFEENPIVTYPNAGTFTVSLRVIAANATDKIETIQIEVLENNIVAQDETFQGFEDRDFETDGWSVERGSPTSNNWRISNNAAFEESAYSAYAPNFLTTVCDSEVSLVSPFLNVNSNRVFEVGFDVAYAFDINKAPDSLQISYATDGGEKFITAWQQGGTQIQTAPVQTAEFRPSDNQWKSYKIYVGVEEGNRFTQFRFKNIGANNNNLYIDNLSIKAATDLQAPVVSFDVNYPLVMLGEATKFFSQSTFGVDFTWSINGSTSFQVSGSTPSISFEEEGIYDVTLSVSNPIASEELIKNNVIEVIDARKFSNYSSLVSLQNPTPSVAGHDAQRSLARAEYFSGYGFATTIHAVDIFFSEAEIVNPEATFDVVIWSVDANGKPESEFYRQSVSYSLLQRDILERGQFTRVVFEESQQILGEFFVSVELEYESGNSFAIFTENTSRGQGWIQRANGDWLTYDANFATDYSNAISIIISPNLISGTDENPQNSPEKLENLVKLYPNPSEGTFQIETQKLPSNTKIESISVFNTLGQVIWSREIHNPFENSFEINLKKASSGMYLVRIRTERNILTKKVLLNR